MRKYFFRIALPALFSVLLITSCLGDANSSFEASSKFGVIRYDSDLMRKYATVQGGYGLSFITSPEIEGLQEGDTYLISYKIENLSGNYNTIYNATVSELVKLPAIDFFSANAAPQDNGDSVYPTSLSVTSPVYFGDGVGSYFNYNWLVRFNCPVDENQKAKAEIYFDQSRQFDLDGKRLEPNQIIFDIRFKQVPLENGEVQKVGDTYASVNFEDVAKLYTFFKPDFTNMGATDTAVPAFVKFRYKSAEKDINNVIQIKDRLYGSFSAAQGDLGVNYFVFQKPK